ncbi:sensor histidine kinase [Nostoc sp. 'Peltigera membranacea cyanobiont' 210A]|uniref:sensor histidine kinase n=1 Tax=Nostoc sp. 'Peltigera membranacea cyanobiont' 210A TaxID=2014529 RepID=UPI000B95B1AF|nr:ATP-binding protein [Nostoc sp. 'Peltigera membranacea cyanobiont' 210A]OYD95447.1 sensor histidine kinase [Nostoc sp. 'Peltigera membranacea cyanobiont' 210A]
MDNQDNSIQIQELEKTNRILHKKLERCQNERRQLETDIATKEFLLKKVICELEDSQTNLQQRGQELENTLNSLHKMQAQIIQSEKMSALGQMVAGIAHEINNPVSFIYGNITHISQYTHDLLRLVQLYHRYFPNPPAEIQTERKTIDLEFLEKDAIMVLHSMNIGTERIREIVLSLRNFSRLDESEFKAVDIHEGIDNTLMILQHRLKATDKSSGVQIIREYGNLSHVECYAGQLNQVFMNILVNALDALEELNAQRTYQEIRDHPSCITIRTSVVDLQWVKIAIADNGSGIPESIQKQIFNPFFTTKPVGKGTGMGMAISYQIITEKHGGKLEVFSTPGKGTEFVIQIPIQQEVCPVI